MLDTDTRDGVHLVTMRAGENSFDLALVTALRDALVDLAATGGPLVLTGEGRFFSNGLALGWLGDAPPGEAGTMFDRLHEVLARLLGFPGAVVAAVNGHAFGAGAILAAAADYRLQRADRGYLCFPEVDLGMSMSPPFDAVLRLRFPPQSMLHALLTGHRYGGPEAEAAGFVDGVAPEDELLPRALELAGAHVGKDPTTVAAIKEAQHAPALAIVRPAAGPAAAALATGTGPGPSRTATT